MRTIARFMPIVVTALLLVPRSLLAQDEAAKLKVRIEAELSQYYDTPFKITVKDNGVVMIEGSVRSYWDKVNVFRIMSGVPGVRVISNLLQVHSETVPDDVIKAEVESQLALNRAIFEPSKIQVSVDHGVVTLRGTVHFRREAVIAADVASWFPGVEEVVNDIQVLPPPKPVSDLDLTVVVKDLIARWFPQEQKAVQVKAQEGRVILTGIVSRLWVRDEIEMMVRHLRGVGGVDNKLVVLYGSTAVK